ncbi:MAG: ABC transporter permease subunit [Eubacterium sp.]|nr:ABC transporter permease subunit [Eubacterium sp.]MBR1674282.1 ABC transporter permease subunit [Eubacterium sp.]
MTILKREILSQKFTILIWGLAIGLMVAVCIFIYPEMSKQMDQINDMMSSMGSFTKAFGMDKMDFGTLTGYYAVECGNMLGIGGAFFAAILGVSALMKEERDRTAEFLLTHPVSRTKVITQKLISVFVSIIIMNTIVLICSIIPLLIIKGDVDWGLVLLFHLAFLILQFEIAGICFGVSAFIWKFGIGIGIGIAAVFYFMNIISNITADAKALKYITPFGYTDGSFIVNSHSLEGKYIFPGMGFMIVGIVIAYVKYTKKDIRA